MKRWALVHGNTCIRVVEQNTKPTIEGDWRDVTNIFMGPGWQWNGVNWVVPT